MSEPTLFERLLTEVRAEREERRARTPGLPLYPGPTPGEEALEVVAKLCARVEALEAWVARAQRFLARVRRAR